MEIKSKFLNRFQKINNNKAIQKSMKIFGDKILVEMLPTDEIKSKGGVIMSSGRTDIRSDTNTLTARLAIVLMTGQGYYDETTDTDIPLEVQPGNVVLLSDMGLRYYTTFPGLTEYTAKEIALSRETEVHMKFDDVKAFKKYCEALNEG